MFCARSFCGLCGHVRFRCRRPWTSRARMPCRVLPDSGYRQYGLPKLNVYCCLSFYCNRSFRVFPSFGRRYGFTSAGGYFTTSISRPHNKDKKISLCTQRKLKIFRHFDCHPFRFLRLHIFLMSSLPENPDFYVSLRIVSDGKNGNGRR